MNEKTNNEIKAEIKENIKRIEATIKMNFWNKGYVENCKNDIQSYRNQLNASYLN